MSIGLETLKMRRHAQEGASLVEAAIVLPILMLLLFGIIQFGFVLASYITLRNGSAVAARTGILAGTTDTDIQNAARSAISPMLDASRLPNSNITITRDASVTPPRVTVALFYDLPVLASYPGVATAGTSWRLNSSTTMR